MPFDILGKALVDYFEGHYDQDIITHSSLEEEDVLPLPYLFRNFKDMPLIEQRALEICYGNILDIGCGSGSHSLWLQEIGLNVTALDSSKGAIEVCQKRGLETTVLSEILEFKQNGYDTLLLLMNGIGIVGQLQKLKDFLNHLKSLMKPNGQILLDSSDIIYMFEIDENDGGHWVPRNVDYYGEVEFQMEYKGEKGPIFDWLYLDYSTLNEYAARCGFKTELLVQGEHYDYLAKLTLT
ncbi:class I SAM-dependent methyltransferase [Croceivirga thetidis]|uniref:Methyltransferase domain-containing protein n=1 Tax=Croceivirga thetidis TaxID=2721623 RepID=A0ABX1GU36_9FLAO|nr:methyltransferase domain-containing protein [Croceivirga thetidis]NKI33168.1 methyltransferase domain-containing protein [Croceivirga thetidis]